MTKLIHLDAALAALDSHAHGTTTLGGQTYRSITLEVAVEALQAIPTIDPAAIREAALKEAAYVAINACLVPPDGGSPTEEDRLVCEEAYRRIIALIGEKK